MALHHAHDVEHRAAPARLRTIAERIGFRSAAADQGWSQIRSVVVVIATTEKDQTNVRRRSLIDDNPASG
jgi:hypothetical protein